MTKTPKMDKVDFTQMKDGTKEEYEFLNALEIDHTRHTADRLLKALVELDESLSGYQITRLGHSLQSDTLDSIGEAKGVKSSESLIHLSTRLDRTRS